MDNSELRSMLDDVKHPAKGRSVCDRIYRAYLEHGAAKRVAPLLGCKPSALSRLIAEYPQVREARDRALREVSVEKMRALRRRLGVPEPEEKAPAPAPPPAPRRQRPGAGGPPLTMTLVLDILPHIPPEATGEDEKRG